MKDAIDDMRKGDVHIVIWTETHFEQKHSIDFEKIAQERGYNTYSITRLMRRYDTGSGGVTIMVDKQHTSREMRRSELEDLIWVRVEVGREKMFVGGVYLVPGSSTRKGKAREIIEKEIGGDIARFTQEGHVVLAGDWNCKIGRLASIVGGREFDRRNTSRRADTRGRKVVELMNRSDMVILNGIRGSTAQDTYDGPRGGSVNDYIAVSRGVVDKTSNIEYRLDLKNLLHTDHCGLACTIRLEGNGEVKNEHRGETGVKASGI